VVTLILNSFTTMASYNRNRKHVWELISSNGENLIGQQAIKEEVVSYLKKKLEQKIEQTTRS
jgi:siroheme synthase (precorrin-2 oxidase/ferrochelatase)